MFFRSREPKFVLKVKQNRYEKFIIDELRIESNDIDEMIQQLEDAIIQINTKLAEVVAWWKNLWESLALCVIGMQKHP